MNALKSRNAERCITISQWKRPLDEIFATRGLSRSFWSNTRFGSGRERTMLYYFRTDDSLPETSGGRARAYTQHTTTKLISLQDVFEIFPTFALSPLLSAIIMNSSRESQLLIGNSSSAIFTAALLLQRSISGCVVVL